MPVLHRSGYVQILDRYVRWLGFHNLSYCFITIICADIFYMVMKFLYLKLLFAYICFLSGLSFL